MTIKNYIQRYVLLKINSGDWKKGSKLPSENQLAIKFNCSRITARQALIPLVNSGFLRVIKGKGYIVSEESEDSNLKAFVERYDVVKKEVNVITAVTAAIWNIVGMQEKDRYIIFEKKYFDKTGLLAYQRTYLNNEYIWGWNKEGFTDSITKELAKQGAPITESSIEVCFINVDGMDKIAKKMGYKDKYPIEIVKSFSEHHWIERTVRLVRPDKFRITYSKSKY